MTILQRELIIDLLQRKWGVSSNFARKKTEKIKSFSRAQKVIDILKFERNSKQWLTEQEEDFFDYLIEDELNLTTV